MTDLSPAAQAVRDAALATYDKSIPKDGSLWALDRASVVAALRAAADQVVPSRDMPKIPFDAKRPTAEWHVWSAKQRARAELLAIAAELEGADEA